ncbi:MAG TPA: hypothetical protein VG056_17430 [Pirellulales bacterium]|jgi:hypothetical protein|nr:hypothetical protein [Pirellulales bacterium]
MFSIRCRGGLSFIFFAACLLFAPIGHAADEPSSAAAGLSADESAALAPSRSSTGKPAQTDPAATPQIEGGQVNGRWREGSRLIDKLGYFKLTGDRATFVSSDGKLKFDGLENLAIERIARTIGDSPDPLEWSISGIITECRGANYLLVTQAVLKTKATRTRRAP